MSDNVVVGEEVQKVGQTTGWTRGRVAKTCVDLWTERNGVKKFVRCAQKAWVYNGSGDSGGPVFRRIYGNEDGVTFLGLSTASSGEYPVDGHVEGQTLWFSRAAAIADELGPITFDTDISVSAPGLSTLLTAGVQLSWGGAVSNYSGLEYSLIRQTYSSAVIDWEGNVGEIAYDPEVLAVSAVPGSYLDSAVSPVGQGSCSANDYAVGTVVIHYRVVAYNRGVQTRSEDVCFY